MLTLFDISSSNILCNNHPSLRALYDTVRMCFTQRADTRNPATKLNVLSSLVA